VEQVTVYDVQYILQREDVTGKEAIYRLRQERNFAAARKAYAYFQKYPPDVVIVPNGMIQEYGAVYEAARVLDIPVVTYEFGEQDQRTWLARNQQVMYFNSFDDLWTLRRTHNLNQNSMPGWERSWRRAKDVPPAKYLPTSGKTASAPADRRSARTWAWTNAPWCFPDQCFGRFCHAGPDRFSRSMTEWIERVIPFFANRPEVQLLVRIHPAETWTVGPSVAEIIHKCLPICPPISI